MQAKRIRSFFRMPEGGMFTGRMLVALILPLMAEQFLALFVGMADTIMVTSTGENAVSAVSLVDSVNVLLIQIFSAMGAGGSIIAAQYLGKKDQKNACAAAKQLLIASFAIAMAIALPCVLFRHGILGLLYRGIDPDIMANARTYFLLSALSYPALALYNGGVGLLRAMGNSKASMWTSLVMNIINVAGNAAFIYGLKMGVAGAGLASLISRCVSCAIILRLVSQRSLPIHLESTANWKPDFSMIRRITAVGVPNGLENSLFQVGKLIIVRIIASFPAYLIAANAVANNITGLVYIPGSAIGLATLTVIGQCIGAGDAKNARAYGNRFLAIMFAVEVPLNLLLFLFTDVFTGIYSLSPEAAAQTIEILKLYSLMGVTFWMPSFGLPCILRAAGDVRFCMAVSMVSMLVLRLGLSYVFVLGCGMSLNGVWYAMYCDWIARAAAFLWRYFSGGWLRHRLV